MPALFQVAMQYSNAVLVAVLPHVSDFAQKLELPIALPVTQAQVYEFKCDPRPDHIGGLVTLTNGGQFWFVDGYVNQFRSPRSYFLLQDPDRIPEFYGPVNISKSEAIEVARGAIKKLGYSEVLPIIQHDPEVILPEEIGTNHVARYRVRWITTPAESQRSFIDIEVNSSNKRIHMLSVFSPDIPKVDIKIDERITALNSAVKLKQPVPKEKEASLLKGIPQEVFLRKILPEISEFSKKLHLTLPNSLSTNDVDYEKTQCWDSNGNMFGNIRLKHGECFTYYKGYVSGYYAPDSSQVPGEKNDLHKFVGKVNLTEKQAVKIARQAIKRLGWDKILRTDMQPEIAYPTQIGRFTLETGTERTNIFARYFVCWTPPDNNGKGTLTSSVEIDASTKEIKSVHANHPKLWKNTTTTNSNSVK